MGNFQRRVLQGRDAQTHFAPPGKHNAPWAKTWRATQPRTLTHACTMASVRDDDGRKPLAVAQSLNQHDAAAMAARRLMLKLVLRAGLWISTMKAAPFSRGPLRKLRVSKPRNLTRYGSTMRVSPNSPIAQYAAVPSMATSVHHAGPSSAVSDGDVSAWASMT